MSTIIGISFERMDESKSKLSRASDAAQEEKNKLIEAATILGATSSPKLKSEADVINDMITKVNKRMDNIERVMASIDYSITKFQEVDERIASRIKNSQVNEIRNQKLQVAGTNVGVFSTSSIADSSKAWDAMAGDITSAGRKTGNFFKKNTPVGAGIVAAIYDNVKGVAYGVPKGIIDIYKGIENETKKDKGNPTAMLGYYVDKIRTVTDDRLRYERIIKPMGISMKDSFNKQAIHGDRFSRSRYATNSIINVALCFTGAGELKTASNGAKIVEATRIAQAAKIAKIAKIAEAEKIAKEANILKLARIEENVKKVEAIKVAKVAEEAKVAKAAKVAEEVRIAKIAQEAKVAETARITKVARDAEIARIKKVSKVAEEAKVAKTAKVAEEVRIAKIAQDAKVAEAARVEKVVRDAEIAKIKKVPKDVYDAKKAAVITKGISSAKISKVEINTSNSVKKVINNNGCTVDEFSELLRYGKVLSPDEQALVTKVRNQIGKPIEGTVMNKLIPQRDIYNYLYNENYNGVRGFVSVDEHSSMLKGLDNIYEGNRVDYNGTNFKLNAGISGLSSKGDIGMDTCNVPDSVYGKISYVIDDTSKVSIPKDIPTLDNAPYSGNGFTASSNSILPELTQLPRKFMNGDILSICDRKLGNVTQQFMYGKSKGWVVIK